MKLKMFHGLPFCRLSLRYRGADLSLDKILVDTGSCGTVFSADQLLALGVRYEPGDEIQQIQGVGGKEFVFSKQLDRLGDENIGVEQFVVQIGSMNYGIEMDGILGMDFLKVIRAVIDLEQDCIRPSG